MKFSHQTAKTFLPFLYHTAEKYTNDVIANHASALAVKIEQDKTFVDLSEVEMNLVNFSKAFFISSGGMATIIEGRRNPYKRRAS